MSGLDAGTDRLGHSLLAAVTRTALVLLDAAAAAVLRKDRATGELVFEAVSGQGAARLPGTRIPPGTGVLGMVAAHGEPMRADGAGRIRPSGETAGSDPADGPRSGGVTAVPVMRGAECAGVLGVIESERRDCDEAESCRVLGLLAEQAAVGIELVEGLEQTDAAAAEDVGALASRITERLPTAAPSAVSAALRILAALDDLLRRDGESE